MTTEAIVRIDKGLKRGPRKPKIQRRPGPGTLRRNEQGQVQAIPDNLDHKEVLARYLTEETTSQIAQSYGIKRKSMIAWLRKVAPAEWRAVQLIRAHDRKEIGNEGLETAPDALSLARAREIVRSAQWELQALDPDYRPKQEIQSPGAPTLQITVVSSAAMPSVLNISPAESTQVIEDAELVQRSD